MATVAGLPGLSLSATVHLIVFLLNFLLTCYVVWDTLTNTRDHTNSNQEESSLRVYEDEDGTATEESQKHHRASKPKWIALCSASLGLSISILVAVLTATLLSSLSTAAIEYWLAFGSWVSSVPQVYVNADIEE